ncbi:MAG: hypothetical protein WDZ41_04725 [Candidatus Babeliales bacterium]
MEKKKTMGNNPLEAYLTTQIQEKAEEKVALAPIAKKKERITIHLPVDLIDQVKNVVYWEPGLTLTGFAEYAFEQALKEQEGRRGEPYPERKEKSLKSGRPMS